MIRRLYICLVLPLAGLTGPAVQADANIRVVVPVRDIARGGEVLANSDLTFGNATGTALMTGTLTNMDAATGMEASPRAAAPAKFFSAADLRRPVVVNKAARPSP